MTDPTQADAPRSGDRQYHIALERGELAEYILLVGDPGRVAKVAERWDDVGSAELPSARALAS